MDQEGSVIQLAAVGSSKHAKHLFTSFNMAFVTDLQCGNDCRSRMHGVTSDGDTVSVCRLAVCFNGTCDNTKAQDHWQNFH